MNALCPAPVETPLLLAIFDDDPAALERRRAHWPTGRLAKPGEIVRAALFLASDESSYVTGSTFLVDGGLTAAYVTPDWSGVGDQDVAARRAGEGLADAAVQVTGEEARLAHADDVR